MLPVKGNLSSLYLLFFYYYPILRIFAHSILLLFFSVNCKKIWLYVSWFLYKEYTLVKIPSEIFWKSVQCIFTFLREMWNMQKMGWFLLLFMDFFGFFIEKLKFIYNKCIVTMRWKWVWLERLESLSLRGLVSLVLFYMFTFTVNMQLYVL